MRVIVLTKGYKTILDEKDYLIFSKLNWCANVKGSRVYAYKTKRYGPRKEGKYHIIYLHRLIMNVKKGEYVDHINRDTLDNRKCNLRICINQQNAFNSEGQLKQRKYSKYKGVKKNANCKTWSARITISGKSIYLGSFKFEKLAANAYNEAAEKYHGSFARKNKI